MAAPPDDSGAFDGAPPRSAPAAAAVRRRQSALPAADRPSPPVSPDELALRALDSSSPQTAARPRAAALHTPDAPTRGVLEARVTARAFADSPALPRARGAQSPPEREPTVHVTIGRVEVRTTAEPAPPRREASGPAPVLGLNDYLLRRHAEGRR